MLLTWNNLSYYQKLMQDIRAAIEAGAFEARTAGDFRGLGEGRYSGPVIELRCSASSTRAGCSR